MARSIASNTTVDREGLLEAVLEVYASLLDAFDPNFAIVTP